MDTSIASAEAPSFDPKSWPVTNADCVWVPGETLNSGDQRICGATTGSHGLEGGPPHATEVPAEVVTTNPVPWDSPDAEHRLAAFRMASASPTNSYRSMRLRSCQLPGSPPRFQSDPMTGDAPPFVPLDIVFASSETLDPTGE